MTNYIRLSCCFISLLLITSCNQLDLAQELTIDFNEMLSGKDRIKVHFAEETNNEISLELEFISYEITETEHQKLAIAYLIYSSEFLNSKNKIIINFFLKGEKDFNLRKATYDESKIKSIYHGFESSLVFRDILEYSFREFKVDDVYQLNQGLKVAVLRDFNADFDEDIFTFLRFYSEHCSANLSDLKWKNKYEVEKILKDLFLIFNLGTGKYQYVSQHINYIWEKCHDKKLVYDGKRVVTSQ